MGLGKLLTRSTQYTVTDTVSGASTTYFVTDNISPDFVGPNSYRGGMMIPGAWRAALLLSDLLGQFPWHAYRQAQSGGPETRIYPDPPLLAQPSPPDTKMTTFSSWALDLIWHGNSIGLVAARNALGWPTAALPVPATAVSVRRVTPWIDSPLPVGALEYAIGSMRLGAQDVIHIKGPCEPGAVRGLGVLESHLQTLNLARDLQRQASSVATHGVPSGVITSDNPDLTDDEASAIKQQWLQSQSTRTVAVLNSATHFEALSWNPEELELVEARKMSLTELELVFGLPHGWLGGFTSSRSYANVEQDAINLLKFSVGGHLARFEETLSLALPRGTTARATTDAILRADTMSRYAAHKIALGGKPFLTVDEVRDQEHLPPAPPELLAQPAPNADPNAEPDGSQSDTGMPPMGMDPGMADQMDQGASQGDGGSIAGRGRPAIGRPHTASRPRQMRPAGAAR